MTADNRRIARNTVYLYGRLLFVLVISLYTVRAVLNALGVEDYGIYNVVGGFVSMFGFLNASMANAIQRFFNFEIGKNGPESSIKVYNTAIRIQIILAIVVIIACEIVGQWYINTKMAIPYERVWIAKWLFQFSLLSLCLTILQIPYSAAIMAYERMDFYAIVGVIDVLLKLGIALLIQIFTGDKLLLYGILLFVISIVDIILYYGYVRLNFRWLIFSKNEYSIHLQKEMLSFSGWSLLGSFSYMFRGQGVNMLLNYFFGVLINAANGIANHVSSALQQFSANLIIAFKPQLVESYASGNYDRTREIFFMMSKISYTFIYIIAVPVLLQMDAILSLWLGYDYPKYTSEFASLIIIMMVIGSLHTPITQTIQATGKIVKFQIITSLIICSIVPITWICFMKGGAPTACYMAGIAVYLINHFFAMGMLKDVFDYSYIDYCKAVLIRCFIFSVLLPIIPFIVQGYFESSGITLLVTCMTTVFVSIPLFILCVLNRKERSSILVFIRYKIFK